MVLLERVIAIEVWKRVSQSKVLHPLPHVEAYGGAINGVRGTLSEQRNRIRHSHVILSFTAVEQMCLEGDPSGPALGAPRTRYLHGRVFPCLMLHGSTMRYSTDPQPGCLDVSRLNLFEYSE